MEKKVFREYDLRGVYGVDITDKDAYQLGQAYGNYLVDNNYFKCVVGHDNRISSPVLYDNFIKGVLDTNCTPVGLGLVTTPMCYYASIKLDIVSRVMITASHNPKEDNGFKISFFELVNARGQMIYDFYDYYKSYHPKNGYSNLETYNIEEDYINLMKESLKLGNKKIKVVIDCGNATPSVIAPKIFSALNIDYVALYCESDGNFPNHHPDPSVEANLSDLKEKVLAEHADLGIAFDGDGDRVGVVDEKGNMIRSDELMIIIWRNIYKLVTNKKGIMDVKCSKSLEDELIKLGIKPVINRTGNSYAWAKIKEENIPFGGELSGHIYFNERFPGFDSGIYAGLRLIEILSNTDKPLSSLLEGVNKYYATNEEKIKCEDENKQAFMKKFLDYVLEKKYKYSQIDGIKVLFDNGWVLVRPSNTGNNITTRMESNTKENLDALYKEFMEVLKIITESFKES